MSGRSRRLTMSDSAAASGVTLLDGNAVAGSIRVELKGRIDALLAARGRAPGLAVVLVGARTDSATYVRMKRKACAEVGILDLGRDLPADASQEDVLAAVRALNADPAVDGILVQLPLPAHMDEATVLDAIDASKDADGLHPFNMGCLVQKGRTPASYPCTPWGCIELLKRAKVTIEGKHAVVLGRSNIVGVPVSQLLLQVGGGWGEGGAWGEVSPAVVCRGAHGTAR